MHFATEAAQADHEVQRKPSEPVAAKEATAPGAAPVLGKFLSALGTDGENGTHPHMLSSPLMRHRANGEMRAQVMRQAQQGLGNHKTQRLFSQARPTALVQRQCACGGTCSSCQAKRSETLEETEETRVVQRQPNDHSTNGMHQQLEDRFAQEHGRPPEGGAHGSEYANWLEQPNYDAAVALLQSRDPIMYGYLRQGRIGQTVRVRTVSVPVQGGGANSPTSFEFRFDLEAISGGVQSGALAQFLTQKPEIQMTVPTATAALRMPMNFVSPDGPNAALRLAEYLYHEGIHMLLAMDRLIEMLIPGSTGLQSGQRAAVEAYRAQVRGNAAYLVLAADLEVVIGGYMTRHNQSQAQSEYQKAAQRVINGVIDERFAVDQQRKQFPGNPVSNFTIAQAYIPNELQNELIVLSNADLARLIQEMTAVLNLIPAGSSAPAASPSSSPTPQSAPTQPQPLQRQTANTNSGIGAVDDKVIPADSPGQPLDHGTRGFMDSRFGADFSDVRVHTDGRAAQSADALAANAYTTGRDIYFAAGKYAPGSREGQHLLAHELTHTVQQGKSALPMAASPVGSVIVGDVSDPLEAEAQRAANAIQQGRAPALSQSGTVPVSALQRAKKGESEFASDRFAQAVTSLRTRLIQRQQAGAGTAAPQPAPPTSAPVRPRPGAEEVWFQGVHLADDREWVRAELRLLIARSGLKGAEMWFEVLVGSRATYDLPFSAHARAFGGLRVQSPLDMQRQQPTEQTAALLKRFTPMVSEVYGEVRAEAIKFLTDFQEAAKKNAHKVLEAQETQAKAEGMRYGITSETIEKIHYHVTGEGPTEKVTEYETTYHMTPDSQSAKGLQGAAQVLLARREKIEKLQEKQRKQVKWERDPMDPKGRILVPDEHYDDTGKEIEKEKAGYEQLRSYVTAEYPALAAFSDIGKGTEGLQTIAKKGPGPLTATLIGEKIDDILRKIAKARRGINDGEVNVWRLPKIVDVTAIQLGAETDGTKRRLIADKREDEQPGFWQDLALLVLNIAAIALAGPTGGLSLAVAAGANVAVAAVHVEEYLMKEALSGSAFDKAQALSQEEPSLFWLAVEIVGAIADVGMAAGAMKTLGQAVKVAQTATEAEQATKALETVRAAAKTEGGAELAERIVARIKELRSGSPSVVLKAAGATEEEINILQKSGRAAEAEAAAGIGKAVRSATGEVKLSKSGHLWSCASPCEILREKYARVFAKSDDVSKGFFRELQQLEVEADKAAKARLAAQANKDAGELAKVDKLAENVKQQAAALEERIQLANPGGAVDLTEKQWQRLQRVSEALKDDSKWGNVTARDRLRLGRVYDKLMETLVTEGISRAGGKTLHYVEVDAALIGKLREGGGRVLITEGKIGGLRFDMLEINFTKGSAELIDLAATSSSTHVAKTNSYKKALEELLNMKVEAKEMLYTGPNGELLETLTEVVVK